MNMRSFLLTPQRPRLKASAGFSLIEIMVGIAIAMVGVLIMLEVLITSERQTTTTGSGNDAMSNAAVTINMLEHDLMQAGYGVSTVINSAGMLGCKLTLPITGKVVTVAPVAINPWDPTNAAHPPLLPVGDANTDSLLVMYGNSEGQPEGNVVNSVTGTVYKVQAPTAFRVNDYVIGFDGTCTANLALAKVTAVTATTVTTDIALASATSLFNLGPAPTIAAYRVRSAALERCDFMASDCTANGTQWTQVGANIVSLRALYGSAATAGGPVTSWSQATPTNTCGWVKTPAVQLAVVARSDQYESKIDPVTKQRVCDPVTTTGASGNAPQWSGNAIAPIDLSTNSNWQCYRYQTFENIMPARNMVWGGANSGC
jgi:type IV pilus assembly protein PilW